MGAEDRGPTVKSPAQAVEEGQDHNITEWNQFRIMMALLLILFMIILLIHLS